MGKSRYEFHLREPVCGGSRYGTISKEAPEILLGYNAIFKKDGIPPIKGNKEGYANLGGTAEDNLSSYNGRRVFYLFYRGGI